MSDLLKFLCLCLLTGLPPLKVHGKSKKGKKIPEEHGSMFMEIPGMLGEEYDSLFPYYMKFCATTRYHPYKGKGVQGSIAGHGLYFFKGMCRDPEHPPSGLKLCDAGASYKSSETGVGISVNKGLKNVNFVVIPGLRIFLAANIFESESFDFPIKTRIIHEVLEQQIFREVEFHPAMIPATTLDGDKEEFIARYMFGSDYAISMARNLYCINIPVNRKVMGHFVSHLNHLNNAHPNSTGTSFRGIFTPGTKGDSDYHWNGIFDNCVHPGLNALASLGVVTPKTVNKPLVSQIFNIAIPANTLLDIFRSINNTEIDPAAVYDSLPARETFLKYRWIPQQHGGLVEGIKLARPNGIFKEDDAMFILPHMFKDRKKYLENLSYNPVYSVHGKGYQLYHPNLVLFYKKYQAGLIRTQKLRDSPRYIRLLKNADQEIRDLLAARIRNMKNELVSEQCTRSRAEFLRNQILIETEKWGRKAEACNFVKFVDDFEDYLHEQMAEVRSLMQLTSPNIINQQA